MATLTAPALAEYDRVADSAWAEYQKVTASAKAAALRATLNRDEVDA